MPTSTEKTAELSPSPAAPSARSSRKMVCQLQEVLTADEAASFDRFVDEAPYTSCTQRTSWIELAPATRLRRFLFLTCREGDRIRVTGLARLTRLFPRRYLARFGRGPVFHDVECLDRALPRIKELLREASVCTAIMNPRWEDDGARRVEEVLARHGMRKLPQADQCMHATTGLVDLERPEEEIFAGFQDRCRRDIKRAVKKGLTVRPAASEDEARTIRGRRKELAAMRNIDDLGQPDLVEQWRTFRSNQERGTLLLAEAEGQIIGGLAVVREGDRAIIRGGGAVPVLPKLPRTHNLIWESMRMMKAAGCKSYDLAGMPDDENVDEGERRRQLFKLAFNPRIVRLVPAYVGVLRPLDHAVLFSARQWYLRSRLRRLIGPLLLRK